jgi:succinoglycan biosynthesis transport protein ExoP
VIEPAENPRIESPRKRLAAVGLASLGAFGTALLGVGWREFRLRRVASPEEVSEGLGLRLVGTLPTLPVPNSGARRRASSVNATDPDGGWQEILIESIDAARTVILHDCRADALRTILVTSAAKGEGKSSLSGHLAISLARTGRRTLLADFDLRNPSLHELFDLESGPGVAELLRGEAELDDVYHAVADDLDVITAGHGDARAVRALGQDALPDLLARMAERYEFVVIDSAPLLPVADSLLISQHVDATLLSVYRERSRIPTVFAGYERLVSLGVRVLGVVVTGVPREQYGEEFHYARVRGV